MESQSEIPQGTPAQQSQNDSDGTPCVLNAPVQSNNEAHNVVYQQVAGNNGAEVYTPQFVQVPQAMEPNVYSVQAATTSPKRGRKILYRNPTRTILPADNATQRNTESLLVTIEPTPTVKKARKKLNTVTSVRTLLPAKRKKDEIGPGIFCKGCHRTFGNDDQRFKLHKCNRSKEQCCFCNCCFKVYATIEEYYKHVCITHDHLYNCNVCSARFKTEELLVKHSEIHTQNCIYSCSICSLGFQSQLLFQNHMNSHRQNKPEGYMYSCTICSLTFDSKNNYNNHMFSHGAIQVVPISCPANKGPISSVNYSHTQAENVLTYSQNPAGNMVSHMPSPAGNMVSHLQSPAGNMVSNLQIPAGNMVSHMPSPAGNMVSHLQSPAGNMVSNLQIPAGNMVSNLQTPTGNMVSHMPSPAGNMVSHLQIPAGNMVSNIQSPAGNMVSNIQSPAGNMVSHMPSPAGNMVNNLQTPAGNMVSTFQSPAGNMVNNLQSPTGNMVSQMQNPAINMVSHMQTPAGNMVNYAQIPAPSMLNYSPSNVVHYSQLPDGNVVCYTQVQPANMLQQMQSANMLQQMQSANMLQQMQSANMLQQMQPANMLQQMQSANMLQQMQPANMLPYPQAGNMQPTNMVPYPQAGNMLHYPAVQSANMLQQMQPTNMLPYPQAGNMLQSANMLQHPQLQAMNMMSGSQPQVMNYVNYPQCQGGNMLNSPQAQNGSYFIGPNNILYSMTPILMSDGSVMYSPVYSSCGSEVMVSELNLQTMSHVGQHVAQQSTSAEDNTEETNVEPNVSESRSTETRPQCGGEEDPSEEQGAINEQGATCVSTGKDESGVSEQQNTDLEEQVSVTQGLPSNEQSSVPKEARAEEQRDTEARAEEQCEASPPQLSDGIEQGSQAESISAEQFPCIVCHKIFNQMSELTDHPCTKQTYNCTYCGKIFTGKHASRKYTKHLEIHPSELTFSCPECPHKFRTSRQLRFHTRKHAKSNFFCTRCCLAFDSVETLQAHDKIHSNKPELMCSVCNAKFNYARTLKKHMKDIHSVTIVKEAPE